MAKKKVTYSSAVEELEIILEKIENEEMDVDDLTTNVRKASKLLKICKDKLRNTEEEVEKILNEIDDDQETE